MSAEISFASYYATNFLGALLMLSLLLSRGWRIQASRSESRILLDMILAALAGCVFDSAAWLCDGRGGALARFGVYASNTLLFSLNLVIGPGFVTLVTRHIHERLPGWHRRAILVLCALELSLLVVNLFAPLVFFVDGYNVYHRAELFWIYIALELALLVYGAAIYLAALRRGRLLRFFPVWLFFLPLVLGIAVQCFVYGVSLIWPSVGVSLCALTICLQKESIYLDKLTGVFNRFYLDEMQAALKRCRGGRYAALMLDMNGFKSINDRFSHAEGDAALIAVAGILTSTVRTAGAVIRFAGDEFIIVLERAREGCVEEYRGKILSAIEVYNKTSGKPYALSAAVGGGIFDAERDGITDCLSAIDRQMYADKQEYYRTHDRRSGR
ncbi:MAG: diguanylate cyclase [Oscillospiraceae bacterium]|nr:diguanylate cyclase [Oscillospiraceae bacterium]